MDNSPHVPSRDLTEHLAYEYWQNRGAPYGSSEVDWIAAETTLAAAQKLRRKEFSLCSLSLEATESSFR